MGCPVTAPSSADEKGDLRGESVSPHGAQWGSSPGRFARFRERVRSRPEMNAVWRCGVGVLGGVVLVAGLIMIPYPGPGWLVVFIGLAILATEFDWARRLRGYARVRYDRWNAWQHRQHGLVRLAVLAATAGVVLLTLWVLGALGFAAGWLGLDWPTLDSPLGVFA